ncbi:MULTISPECIES: hypothetical protein [unclassified Rathayibacter]|uniref:hypothetical protein n=1 Tax=unclassified Rathayibacter TaxID=2609250 RepID=UPI00104AD373|nr:MULTISPECIES: hypothetical protein [unclassified Rathayibacter]TCL77860.1 hypothetical protein EDF49_1143 [Rathayibacter sp. PhB192]TCM23797.1 hypothetical protein EDF43_11484 [Rathayibacter sp. PhB179]
MTSRRNALITNLTFGVGGLALGACLATVIDGRWTADWVGATGTWFGSIATVLALLWAVQSFRADQADREQTRAEARDKEAGERIEREASELTEARNVSIALRGGAGFGDDPNKILTGVHVDIRNHSKHDVVVPRLRLDDKLHPLKALPDGIHVPAGETVTKTIDIKPTAAQRGEAGGGSLARLTADMDYRVDGRDWRRSSSGDPERI